MNFFRKKNQIIVSFTANELQESIHRVKKSLLDLAPFPAGGQVRLNAGEIKDIPAGVLATLVSFSGAVRESGATLELRANADVVEAIRLIGVEKSFDLLEVLES